MYTRWLRFRVTNDRDGFYPLSEPWQYLDIFTKVGKVIFASEIHRLEPTDLKLPA